MAMPIVTMSLPVNVFMTALVAKAFMLPKTTIGLISALPVRRQLPADLHRTVPREMEAAQDDHRARRGAAPRVVGCARCTAALDTRATTRRPRESG
jgi:hypothetical protein